MTTKHNAAQLRLVISQVAPCRPGKLQLKTIDLFCGAGGITEGFAKPAIRACMATIAW